MKTIYCVTVLLCLHILYCSLVVVVPCTVLTLSCVFVCVDLIYKGESEFVFVFVFFQNIVCNCDPNYNMIIKYMEFEPVCNNVTRF